MLFAGLFCATFATLLLEILDGRLLSVLTWYHLSFLAVSLAMLGMAAGAIRVFLGGPSLSGESAVRRLPRAALAFALTMALSHVVVLTIPLSVQPVFSTIGLASLTTTIVTLTIPFYFSGMIVTIVLTRTAAPIGRLYAWDLAGAAFGCLAVVPAARLRLVQPELARPARRRRRCRERLLFRSIAAVAATGPTVAAGDAPGRGRYVQRFADRRTGGRVHEEPPVLVVGAHRSDVLEQPLVRRRAASRTVGTVPVGRRQPAGSRRAGERGVDGDRRRGRHARSPSGTGVRSALDWVRHDVTTLPYYVRRGSVAIIGFGGGRDILAAIWGQNSSITGVDVNQTMIQMLTGSHRRFAGVADRPEVRFVHDDGRSFLTRTKRTLRRHPDVADRHLGRHRRGCVQPLGERSLHDRGLGRRALPPDADGRFQRVQVVRARIRLRDQQAAGARHGDADRSGDRGPAQTDTARLARSCGDAAHLAVALYGRGSGDRSSALPAARRSPSRSRRGPAGQRVSSIALPGAGRGTIWQQPRQIRDSTSARPPTTGHSFSTCSSQQASRRRNRCPRRVWRAGISTRRRRWWCSSGSRATLVCVTIVGPLVAHGRPPMSARAFAASVIYFPASVSGSCWCRWPCCSASRSIWATRRTRCPSRCSR